ncbi:MAG: hypothetical protein P8X69_03990 [Maritimibacter sp.]
MIGRGAQATRAMALPDRMAPMFPSHMPHRHMPHRHTIRILPQPGQALALTFDDGPHHTNTPAMLDVKPFTAPPGTARSCCAHPMGGCMTRSAI